MRCARCNTELPEGRLKKVPGPIGDEWVCRSDGDCAMNREQRQQEQRGKVFYKTLYTKYLKAGDSLVFEGCSWDAQWEYDCPCVLYSPVRRYHISGSSGIESMVEEICFDLAAGTSVKRGFEDSDLKEFAGWRWSPNGFRRRKNAMHYRVTVRFTKPDDGYDELNFTIEKIEEIRK
jgi:hypothetical protein